MPIPEPGSWSFPAVIESARAISLRNIEGRAFSPHGLAYSIADLDDLPMGTTRERARICLEQMQANWRAAHTAP